MSEPYRDLFVESYIPSRLLKIIVEDTVGPRIGWRYEKTISEMLEKLIPMSPVDGVQLMRREHLCDQMLSVHRGEKRSWYEFTDKELEASPDPGESIAMKFFELEWSLFSDEEKSAISIGRAIFLAARKAAS